MLRFANRERVYVYGRDPEIASQAKAMTLEVAEALAKDVAHTLTEAWSDPEPEKPGNDSWVAPGRL